MNLRFPLDVTVVDYNRPKSSRFFYSRYTIKFFKSSKGKKPTRTGRPPPARRPVKRPARRPVKRPTRRPVDALQGNNCQIRLDRIAESLDAPLFLVDDPVPNGNRKFILEKVGKIKIMRNGAVLPVPFLVSRTQPRKLGAVTA